MAFFDDLSRKISQTGQNVVLKTKEMSDVARFNSSIAEEEKKLNNYYYQIGKLYAAKHPNDFEEDFSVMINAVKESESKLELYRQQIQDAKGVVRCANCGSDVPNTIAFCSYCGAAMPRNQFMPDDSVIKCTGCGANVTKGMRFCTTCGKTMADIIATQPVQQMPVQSPVMQPPVQQAPVYPAEQPPVYPAEQAPVALACPNCGAPIDADTVFCTQCGAKV